MVWTPGYNGGSAQLTSQTDGYFTTFLDNIFDPSTDDGARDVSVQVNELLPEKSYDFRARASNTSPGLSGRHSSWVKTNGLQQVGNSLRLIDFHLA